MFPPLLVGGRVAIAAPQGHMDAPYLTALCGRHCVTVLSAVNSLAQLYLEAGDASQLAGLRSVWVGGEALTPAFAALVQRVLPAARLVNMYGAPAACWRAGQVWLDS